MTVLRFDDDRGGLAYPFLPDEWLWEIHSYRFDDPEAMTKMRAASPTLRWVKDSKVLDLIVPEMETADFLQRTGLHLNMNKGAFVLSKRLSRLMRPFRYWAFFDDREVVIDYASELNGRLWDGIGQVSRGFVQQLAERLMLTDDQQRELCEAWRLEVTTLHAGGQDKGHVIVVDGLAVDFLFPAGSAKQEVKLANGRFFVGLQPVHGKDEMRLDIQSIINLFPFFSVEQLLSWTQMESGLFLRSLQDGRLEVLLKRLYNFRTEFDREAFGRWHVGEFLASGGQLSWFAGMMRRAAGQHVKRLGSGVSKMRMPAPGGRYYIAPAVAGGRTVAPGHIELDPAYATAWVSDEDWLDFIVDVLGGCDGDDAVWVFPFTDEDGQRQILLWRSPNQLGEYVVLQPTADSHVIVWETADRPVSYPRMRRRLLPTRVDQLEIAYGKLTAVKTSSDGDTAYSIEALWPTIRQAMANQGTLGMYCNALMLCVALYGRLPERLPATLEDVIDGTVKSGLDLTPVRTWIEMAMSRMAAHRPVPRTLQERLPAYLQQPTDTSQPASNWLDVLAEQLALHIHAFQADVEALTMEACPPAELFARGSSWIEAGKLLRVQYGRAMRHLAVATDDVEREAIFDQARQVSERVLGLWPEAEQPWVLLGCAVNAYMHCGQSGEPIRDGIVWQLGKQSTDTVGREAGVADLMLQGLRQIGLLGEPVVTSEGIMLHVDEAPARGFVVINHGWFNWLKVQTCGRYGRMSEVPVPVREMAKRRFSDIVAERFRGMVVETAVREDARVVAFTPNSNLLGYVQPGHELAAIRYDQFRIAWAKAVNGNVHAVLEPA